MILRHLSVIHWRTFPLCRESLAKTQVVFVPKFNQLNRVPVAGVGREGCRARGECGGVGHGRVDERLGARAVAEVALHLGGHLGQVGRLDLGPDSIEKVLT